jgi:ankyrin repeat protein
MEKKNLDKEISEVKLGKDPKIWKGYKGESLLHEACRFGTLEQVKTLIDHGMDIHVVDDRGFNLMDYAIVDISERDEVIDIIFFLLDTDRELLNGSVSIAYYGEIKRYVWYCLESHSPKILKVCIKYQVRFQDPVIAESFIFPNFYRCLARLDPTHPFIPYLKGVCE